MENQASIQTGVRATCRPSWDPCKRYSQLGHHGDLPQSTNLRVSRKPVFWTFLWPGVGGIQWARHARGYARAAPGSHGAIAWHLRLHGGTPVINLGIPERPINPDLSVSLCSIGLQLARPSSLAACTLGCAGSCTGLHLKHTSPPSVPSRCRRPVRYKTLKSTLRRIPDDCFSLTFFALETTEHVSQPGKQEPGNLAKTQSSYFAQNRPIPQPSTTCFTRYPVQKQQTNQPTKPPKPTAQHQLIAPKCHHPPPTPHLLRSSPRTRAPTTMSPWLPTTWVFVRVVPCTTPPC